jgi:hypothetical protein
VRATGKVKPLKPLAFALAMTATLSTLPRSFVVLGSVTKRQEIEASAELAPRKTKPLDRFLPTDTDFSGRLP